MEDALVPFGSANSYTLSFVLILVLMEDALVLSVFGAKIHVTILVLILVLMEDALVLLKSSWKRKKIVSLNPCFNGRCTSTAKLR